MIANDNQTNAASPSLQHRPTTSSTAQSDLPRVNILGVGIQVMTMKQALSQISAWIDNRVKAYVSVCTVHTIMECQRDQSMRQTVNRAGLTTPDGMPLVWLGRWRTKIEGERVYGPDLMLALCKLSVERGYNHYFYGGATGTPELLAKTLQQHFPGLAVVGTYSPPFRPLTSVEDEQIVDQINEAKPDIVWVGLGTPKQDLWMAAHRDKLNAPILIGIGAAFDFHTGRIPQAPRWMQRSGLEWLFRLLQEPRRLWYRYLVYNPAFIILTVAQLLGLKRYELDIGFQKTNLSSS